jgi:poly-gamma-glutamate capsule biosynthesis protein CapA/YwtB (metallophosphatase superfamily)
MSPHLSAPARHVQGPLLRVLSLAFVVALTASLLSTSATSVTPAHAAGLPVLTKTVLTETASNSPDLVIAFAGDVHFERHLAKRTQPGGLASVRSLFAGADVVVVNLETAITTRGTRVSKDYNFRTNAQALTALRDAGVDVLSLANNHAMDFGAVGLSDTLRALKRSPLRSAGIGTNSTEAVTPARIRVPHRSGNGHSVVSVFSFSTVEPFDDMPAQRWAASSRRAGIALWPTHRNQLLDAIATERSLGHLVAVVPHWGIERASCPSSLQKNVAAQLSRAGAQIIAGAHPHVLQGAGFNDRGTVVAHSLGNFIWYNNKTSRTAVLLVAVRAGQPRSITVIPASIGSDGMPAAASAKESRIITSTVLGARAQCAGLSLRPTRSSAVTPP